MKSAKRQRKKANVMNNLDEHILSFWNRQHIQTWPKVCVRGKYYSLLLFQLLIFDPFKFALLELGRGGTNIQYLVYSNVNQHSNKFLPIWILFIILYIEYIHSLAYKLIFTVETWQIDKLPSRISHLSVSFLQWNSLPPASVLLDCKQE